MTEWEYLFFIVYIVLQVAIPLFRYLKFLWRPKESRIYGDYFWYFSWTMKLKATEGSAEIRVFEHDTGNTVIRSDLIGLLPDKQYHCLYSFPSSAIQYAKHIEEKFSMKSRDYGLNMRIICDLNEHGSVSMVNEEVDFTQEPIKYFGTYKWYLGD